MMMSDPTAVVDWTAYFSMLSAFAGTVFAITLAAKQLRNGSNHHASSLRKTQVELAESAGVTYELAAAAVFAAAFVIRASFVSSFVASLAALLGVVLILWHWVAYIRLVTEDRTSGSHHTSYKSTAWIVLTVLPLASYVCSFILFLPAEWQLWSSTDWLALFISWLVLSGTFQAIRWFVRTWGQNP